MRPPWLLFHTFRIFSPSPVHVILSRSIHVNFFNIQQNPEECLKEKFWRNRNLLNSNFLLFFLVYLYLSIFFLTILETIFNSLHCTFHPFYEWETLYRCEIFHYLWLMRMETTIQTYQKRLCGIKKCCIAPVIPCIRPHMLKFAPTDCTYIFLHVQVVCVFMQSVCIHLLLLLLGKCQIILSTHPVYNSFIIGTCGNFLRFP